MKRSALKSGAPPKRRKTAMKARTRKQRLRDECDAVWRRLVKREWEGACAVCVATGADAHHLIGRGHHATRYELANGMLLCRACHGWAHGKPDEFGAWLGVQGLGWRARLRMMGMVTVTVTEAWLEAQLERLREMERGV